ncbi:hypothetical protein C5E02_11270 [Rathayibacter rathayi]|uniref:Uncharacterized protein n=1 Tax=Rathayibacter rathayi TaxID=33887 RepID=A0ABD6W6L3_RATRA|nr:hypothetical protein C5C04_11025 [Rathayibacter rathayi]PPH99698.1 hypothetical protein C5C43_11180 [Rathayibacter rathayi]PPI08032.1 hypothetical protein C5D23_11130 [Rathayibacter rathayi]PPI59979.1 hypothetical protein C5E02_11270 [Rathayibacter rathayi]
MSVVRLAEERTAFWLAPRGVVASLLCALIPISSLLVADADRDASPSERSGTAGGCGRHNVSWEGFSSTMVDEGASQLTLRR